MLPMKNLWFDTITNFDSALLEVEECLSILKENARSVDFNDLAVKQQFSKDIMYTKQLFEKGEVLARSRQRKNNVI